MALPWLKLVFFLTAANTLLLLFSRIPSQQLPTPTIPSSSLISQNTPCPSVQPCEPVSDKLTCPTCEKCEKCEACEKCETPSPALQQPARQRPPTLVVYVYSEAAGSSNSQLKVDNLAFFIKYGLCEHCTNVEFIFIINGPAKFDKFPKHKNVRVINREDTCAAGDFAAWDYLFTQIDRKKYKRFMFINDTVRGPYVDPAHAHLLGPDFHFTDIFGALLSNETKLVGSYLNCGGIHGKGTGKGYSHIQTMSWMTDDIGLEVIKPQIRCYYERYEAITHGEIGMSRKMIEAGYNIGSTLWAYRGVDFRKDPQFRDMCNEQEDPTFTDKYFGTSIHPIEVVFFKNSREGGNWPIIDTYTKFVDEMGKNPV